MLTAVIAARSMSQVAHIAVLCEHGWESVSRRLGLLHESRSSTQSVSSSVKCHCVCVCRTFETTVLSRHLKLVILKVFRY